MLGSRADRAFVAGSMYEQPFDLGTSTCLDEPHVRVPVHGVRVQGGRAQVALAVAVPERAPA